MILCNARRSRLLGRPAWRRWRIAAPSIPACALAPSSVSCGVKSTYSAAAILEFYRTRLKDLAWPHTTNHDRAVKTDGSTGSNLYYLMFVSKLDIAAGIMDSMYQGQDYTGQIRFKLE